jgi:hypothetical protein
VVQLRYLGMTVTNQDFIRKQITWRWNSACYHSVQNLLSSCLLSKNAKILPLALYGIETWSLTLREEHRLKMFEKRVLRIFGLRGDEVTGGWKKLHNEGLHNLFSLSYIIRIGRYSSLAD